MKRFYLLNITLFLLFTNLFGQIENLKTHSQMSLDCKKCHICDTPTKANPCLIMCPRNKIEVVRHSPSEGPDDITINRVQNENDMYGPVDFTHKLHSEMSLMAGGCSICHHFNPPGKIVKCNTCHETSRVREDLSKPDLKAAFHRQCMGCHKTWENESKCESCHLLNSKKSEKITNIAPVKSHPDISIPIKIIYETNSDEGNIVTFFHNDHSSLFGYECSDCHDSESCANCHSELKLDDIQDDVHDRCSSCHDVDNSCKSCHKDDITAPFSHLKKTGFDLSTYHNGVNCSACHTVKNKFTGLKKDCVSCHVNKDGSFDHLVTGLKLDETHTEFYCENCHNVKDYSKKPTCIECHDEDINYPDSLPGKRIKSK